MKQMTDKAKNGFTLVETIIAIAIFTMGMLGFSLLFVKVWKSNLYSLEMGRSSFQVSQGVNVMANYIRRTMQSDNGSYALVSADDNDLILYSDYNKDGITERLHFYKSGTTIYMGVTSPTNTMPKTYPSGDQQTLTIAENIVNTSSEPVFSYYNKDYPGDTTNNPVSTPATIANVRLLKISLHINIDPNRPPDNIQMQTFVEMRNLNDYDRLN